MALHKLRDSTALHDALAKLVVAALNRLPSPPWPAIPVQVPEFQRGGGISFSYSSTLDAASLVGRLTPDIHEWPELQEIVSIAQADPSLAAFFTTENAEAYRAFTTALAGAPASDAMLAAVPARAFLEDYLLEAQERSPEMDSAVFDRLYDNLRESLETRTRQQTMWLPTFELSLPDGAISLTSGVALEEITVQTRSRLVLAAHSMPDDSDIGHGQVFIAVEERLPWDSTPSAHEESARWILAMRLVAGGDCQAGRGVPVFRPGDYRTSSHQVSGAPRTVGPSLATTLLRTEDLDRVRAVREHLPAYELEFPVAVSRFAQLPTRVAMHDRFIDSFIALENLLLPGTVKDELRFRFSLRGAWLLASGAGQRQEMCRQLQRLYDRRSAIVHGDAKAVKQLDLTVAAEVGELLRTVLLLALERGLTRALWQEYVEAVVFGE